MRSQTIVTAAIILAANIFSGCNQKNEQAAIQTGSVYTEKDIEKLPTEQQNFYRQLKPTTKSVFLSLSPEEKEDALAMTKPTSPPEAVLSSSRFDVYALPLEQQLLYHQLNPKFKVLFLALEVDTTDSAVKWAKDIDPNEAVEKAAKEESSHFPDTYQAVFNQLNIDMQTLFLVLTPKAKEEAVVLASHYPPNEAVKKVSVIDSRRLPNDQQAFYDNLDLESQTLFLILTPTARSLALQMTKSMDPNDAVMYADRHTLDHIE